MTHERRNRRDFLVQTGAGIAVIGGATALTRPSWAATSDPGKADLVVINAKVYTVDTAMPRAEAFAVKNGRFMAVGTTQDITGLIGRGTETFDAKQMMIVPGFIDCHSHAESAGKTFRYGVIIANPLVPTQFTIASVIDKLRAEASKTPPGFWVVGSWYDDTKAKDKRPLNIRDLDKVSTDLPVVVHHVGGHTTYYNSKAFELAGITRNTPNPPGGTFDRDANGDLNGRVSDNAMRLMNKAGKLPTYTPDQELERDREGLATISKEFVSVGLTSVAHQGGNLTALQQVRERGELLHRVNYESGGDVLDAFIAAGIRTGFGDDRIRIGSTSEHTVDGSFEERTMSRATPYPAASNPLGGAGASDPPYYGNTTVTQDDLNAWAERVHRAGIACNCHANGDPAIAMVLTAYERAQKLDPRPDVRHHITHCTHITDDIVRRIKADGVVPNSFTTYLYSDSEKFHFYGDEFMSHCMAFKTWLDAGIPVAAGTDSPPDPNDPRIGIQGMVTRTGWDGESWGLSQRISVDQALLINTLNGAYYMHEEAIKGSITPGKLADYVVMPEDMHTVNPNKIKDIQIIRTVVGGQAVYQV
jgi:predicted amidohydrolase YtcJ